MINLGTKENKKEVKVGASLKYEVKKRLIELLPECPPVKQKLRRTRTYMSLKIREEVTKQLNVGFLAVAKYLKWMANIVPVPKKDDKVSV